MSPWWLLVVFGTCLCVQFFLTLRLRNRLSAPGTGRSDWEFQIPSTDTIIVQWENTVHYQIDGPFADEEWTSLVPGDGIVYVKGKPFLLGVFHELRCLDILRRQLRATPMNITSPDGRRTRHCMQYLRQMVLCRANSRLEVVTGLHEEHNVLWEQDYECRDWRALYKAVKDDQTTRETM